MKLAIVAILAAASTAHADDTRSPNAALALSAGTTIAGYVMVAESPMEWFGRGNGAGAQVLGYGGAALAAIGPSAGQIYAGEYRHAAVFSIVRGAAFVGVAYALSCGRGDDLFGNPDTGTGARITDCSGPDALGLIGGTVLVGLTVYDVIDAPRAVHRREASDLAIAPILAPGAVGVGIAGSF